MRLALTSLLSRGCALRRGARPDGPVPSPRPLKSLALEGSPRPSLLLLPPDRPCPRNGAVAGASIPEPGNLEAAGGGGGCCGGTEDAGVGRHATAPKERRQVASKCCLLWRGLPPSSCRLRSGGWGWGWGDAILRSREASLPFPLGEWFPKWTPSWFRWVPLRVPRGCASSIPTSSPPEGQHPTFLPHFGDKIKGTQVGELEETVGSYWVRSILLNAAIQYHPICPSCTLPPFKIW